MRQASFVGVCFGVFALVAATVGTGAPLFYERFENSAVGAISGGVTFSTDVIAPTVDSGAGAVANGYTAVFDGVNGTYVTHGTGTQVTSTDFTVEGFINVADMSAYRTIASDWGQTAGETRSWAFFVTDTGALRFDVSPDGNYYSNNRLMTGNGIIQTDKWYQVAGVSDGNVSRIYLDGMLVASMTRGTAGGPYTADNADLKVGNIDHFGGGSTQEPFSGSIDELRIDNGTALGRDDFIKSSRVRAWVRAEEGTPGDPAAILLNTDAGSDGTASGGVTYSAAIPGPGAGVVGYLADVPNLRSLAFDGNSGTYVEFANHLDVAPGMGNGFTVEAFIRPDSASVYQCIAGEWNENTASRVWALIITDTGQFRWASSPDGGYYGQNNLFSAPGTIVANEWQHVAAVYDDDTVRLYVNYMLVGELDLPAAGLYDVDGARLWLGGVQWFGGGGGGQYSYAGLIDEFRITYVALDPVEFLHPIPEPASAVLLALGLAGIARRRRRRR